jgi:uncharacterized glyoxalase superfamily protein PhnB
MLTNRSMPDCDVIPEVPYPDLEVAFAWLRDAFGFGMRIRIGDHRAQLNVGRGAIVLTQQVGEERRSCSVLVRVEDIDSHYERALRHGCVVIRAPEDHVYGERQYVVEDFAGHRWVFSESIADVAPETWGGEVGELR